ncbi:MAG: acyl-CoA carboxylase subunit beta [Actinomycetota bacterium]|nr:acyl-CoA carboxylase subunit beta [Actinomycetota bacterium]
MSRDLNTTAGKIQDLRARVEEAIHAGSARAVDKQHAKGKKTARERIEMLVDEGSFTEIDEFARHRSTQFGMEKNRPYGDGVVIGTATVDARPIALYSQDFTIMGGSLGEVHAEKIVKIAAFALKSGIPLIGINDSGGARIQEGVASLSGYGKIFRLNARSSGVIPQISLILGPCAGGSAYSPALTDFIVMVNETSHMFITGPDVIKTVTGEEVDMEALGGARTHNTKTGNSHYLAENEADAIDYVKALLSYLPSNNMDSTPHLPPTQSLDQKASDVLLDTLIPDNTNQPYDMKVLIQALVDESEFLEVHALYAPNIIVGFARIEGESIGIIANQPLQLAGTLDINSSEKAARFLRFCDAFGIPILTLVDVPGFLPGTEQEWDGIIRRGAKLLYAYAEASVPLVTLITRKAYGGAFIVMGSKYLGSDINFAWPSAEIAVMGAAGAVNILYRKELADTKDPVGKRADLINEYNESLANPYLASERGTIDTVIEPNQSRAYITKAFRTLKTKRDTLPARKHGNIPL